MDFKMDKFFSKHPILKSLDEKDMKKQGLSCDW